MEIRIITLEEWKYTYSQSQQIAGMTGCVGHLRGDFGSNDSEFFTTWFDRRADLKTDTFKKELDTIINALRSEQYGLLKNRLAMREYVNQYLNSEFEGNYYTEYGFRVDEGKYAFLLRCNTLSGDYNFYCYCYIAEWLDNHMFRAAKGIRFITPHYKELFCIPDGEKILIEDRKGEKQEKTCRYIDEYHIEIDGRIFHICEFAERMQESGSNYSPLND